MLLPGGGCRRRNASTTRLLGSRRLVLPGLHFWHWWRRRPWRHRAPPHLLQDVRRRRCTHRTWPLLSTKCINRRRRGAAEGAPKRAAAVNAAGARGVVACARPRLKQPDANTTASGRRVAERQRSIRLPVRESTSLIGQPCEVEEDRKGNRGRQATAGRFERTATPTSRGANEGLGKLAKLKH